MGAAEAGRKGPVVTMGEKEGECGTGGMAVRKVVNKVRHYASYKFSSLTWWVDHFNVRISRSHTSVAVVSLRLSLVLAVCDLLTVGNGLCLAAVYCASGRPLI